MATTAIREMDFVVLNGRRLNAIKALAEAAERATELCHVWLESGHVADYRAWQTQLRWLEEADRRYRDIPPATSLSEQ
jgi:hypothetical protein